MAKKDNGYSYLNAAIPTAENKYSVIRWGWQGLNRTDKFDTGQITDCSGVVIDPPYVLPAKSVHEFAVYAEPISIHGFDDNLLVIYRDGGKIKVDYVKPDGTTYTGVMGDAKGDNSDFEPRTAVQFNVAEGTENIVSATYNRKILIFPDQYSVDFDISGNFTPASLGATYPTIKYATVYGSRVFGVDDNRVYASYYNDYARWDLDTADNFNEANAWVSMSQSNAKADGKFSAIASYDNHVVLFKKDFMQLVYNDKNPFRIVDVGAVGCDNPYAVTETERTLFFASPDAVYAFTGGYPKKISEDLGIKDFAGAVLGSYKDTTYMYAEDCLYTFKDGVWSALGFVDGGIRQFATLDYGIAALCEDGNIVFVDWEEGAFGNAGANAEYPTEWWFETDFMALGKLDVRRVKKVSVLCDVAPGASLEVFLLKDGETFHPRKSLLVGQTDGTGQVLLRVLTHQTSAYMHRLRFVGHGYVKVYAAEIKLSWGGDVYVEG
jgi:hypothetical protein